MIVIIKIKKSKTINLVHSLLKIFQNLQLNSRNQIITRLNKIVNAIINLKLLLRKFKNHKRSLILDQIIKILMKQKINQNYLRK